MALTKISRGLLSTGISDSSDATAITIDSSERVGIGTSSPSSKLHVYGGAILVDNGSSAGTIYFHDTTNYINLSSDALQFANNGAERMRITSDGDFLVRQTSADVYDTNTGGTVRQYWGNQFSAQNNQNSRIIIGSASNAGLIGGATVNSGGTKPIVNSYISFGSTSQTAGSEAGMVQFYTSTGGATGAVRARIDSDGLKFGSDTAAQNALDDYEEGTWTPSLPEGGTVNTNYGSYYTKIGRQVIAYFYIIITPTNNNQQFKIGNLPFTCINQTGYYPSGSLGYSSNKDLSFLYPPLVMINNTYAYFHYNNGNANFVDNAAMQRSGGLPIIGQVIYNAA